MNELVEGRRGCGYRKAGGLYLFCGGDRIIAPCGKLPVRMERCPICDSGIKPTRGFQWIDGNRLVVDRTCKFPNCDGCPLEKSGPQFERAGLLWIGEAFYPTPEKWLEEAKEMGASRRVAAVPRGFEVGKTWVFAAHRKAFYEACPECNGPDGAGTGKRSDGPRGLTVCEACEGTGKHAVPAIFHAFRPTEVQYITRGTETAAELEALEKRGITPVKFVPHVGLLE